MMKRAPFLGGRTTITASGSNVPRPPDGTGLKPPVSSNLNGFDRFSLGSADVDAPIVFANGPQSIGGTVVRRTQLPTDAGAVPESEHLHHGKTGGPGSSDLWVFSFSANDLSEQLACELPGVDRESAQRAVHAPVGMPKVGDNFLGFRLIDELGQGAFGKVFLCLQGNLADRPVVLKITPRFDEEPRVLAQLQHTNIVPVYSIHRVGSLQSVCMPYYGATTLENIYQNLRNQKSLPDSGFALISTLYDRKTVKRTRLQEPPHSSPSDATSGEPSSTESAVADDPPQPPPENLKYIEGLTYVQAVLWVVSRLASGLDHAHERGILHLDLKPANILLTDDGQPMLLDFNLAMDLKARANLRENVGGTLLYMSPEQLKSLNSHAVRPDRRSDLFSLGIILFELLTGRRPFQTPDSQAEGVVNLLLEGRLGPPPRVRCWNKAVSPAVESIVQHCLEPDPAHRYQSAHELQEDIESHLANSPLQHAAEPSLRERTSKWMRRHPTISGTSTIATAALITLVILGSASWYALGESRAAKARLHYIGFHKSFEECQLLLNTTHGGPKDHLPRGLRLARRSLRPYLAVDSGAWPSNPLVHHLPATERAALRSELAELIMLEVRAEVALADRGESETERQKTYHWGLEQLALAADLDPRVSAAFHQDRARLYEMMGEKQLAAAEYDRASRSSIGSPREEYLLGTSLLAEGRPDRAEIYLSRATTRDTRQFWSWFALGICHADQGRYADAAFDFSACTILVPNFAWPHLNRGLALARVGRLPEALAAYDRALELDEGLAEAWIDRALVHLELSRPDLARNGLERAMAMNYQTPAVRTVYAESLARLKQYKEAETVFAEVIRDNPNDPLPRVARGFARLDHDRRGAARDFDRALNLDPGNPRAHLGRAYLTRGDDLKGALAHLDKSLEIDPDLGDALQLRALLRARLNDPATEIDVDRFLRVTTPQRLYNAACAFAILIRSRPDTARLTDRAIVCLERALDAGLSPQQLRSDPDLDSLRTSPKFARLLDRVQKSEN